MPWNSWKHWVTSGKFRACERPVSLKCVYIDCVLFVRCYILKRPWSRIQRGLRRDWYGSARSNPASTSFQHGLKCVVTQSCAWRVPRTASINRSYQGTIKQMEQSESLILTVVWFSYMTAHCWRVFFYLEIMKLGVLYKWIAKNVWRERNFSYFCIPLRRKGNSEGDKRS